MVDAATQQPPDGHEDAWALIPWYVNGTLGPDEAETVQRHVDSDPDFAAEVNRQLGVAARVCMLDDPGMAQARDRSWETLRARIEAEESARAPRPARESWLSRLTSGFGLRAVALGAACAAALAVVVVMPSDEGDDFRTLTSAGETTGPAVRFQVAPGVEREALDRLLAEHGLSVAGEPSQGGVWRADAAEGIDPAAAAQALMAAPEILFAAPDAPE